MTRPALLAALAAALAPAQAGAAFSRCADRALAEEAGRLASLPRQVRLAALEEALASRACPGLQAALTAAGAERPRLAALLRSGPGAAPPAGPPLLRRLLLQARVGNR
jgi:hypothetical protein